MWPFKKKKQEIKPPVFTIEYYPETERFYVVYDGMYLKTDYYTGIVETEKYLRWGQSCYTEQEANNLINKFKEQQFKENVRYIKVR